MPSRRLGHRLFCVAGVGQSVLPRGLIVALASRGGSASSRQLPRAQMYALASLGAPSLSHGRRATTSTAKGSDVRLGVPWGFASFKWQAWDTVHFQGSDVCACVPWGSVASMGQWALPRGSDVCPDVPWGSASFTWQAWDNLPCQAV